MSLDDTANADPEDAASQLMREGRVDEALELARRRVGEARLHGESDEQAGIGLVAALERLAALEGEAGNVNAASAALHEALETATAIGAPLPWLARLRTSLATLLDFSQSEADAAPLYEQAILDYESMEPPETETAAQLRNNLAMIYKGLGKFALAEQHYLKAMEGFESCKGSQSEEVAAVYNNLGSLYYTAGFAEQALEMFTEGLRIRRALLGDRHPDVAQSHGNLATVCHGLGDNDKAVEHFESCLDILEANLPDEAAGFEEGALDYLALLEMLGDERRAAALRKRMQKAQVS